MIEPTPAPHGIFIEQPMAGNCFSCVVNLRARSRDPSHKLLRQRRHAAHALQKIQDEPLRRKQRSQRPAHAQQRHPLRIAEPPFNNLHVETRNLLDAKPFVIGATNHLHHRKPARNPHFFLHERTHTDGMFINQQTTGDVVACQILHTSEIDQRTQNRCTWESEHS